MSVRGVFIRESFLDGRLPPNLESRVIERHGHLLGAKEPVEILITSSPSERLAFDAMSVAFALQPMRFYAHFIDGDILWVVYPSTVSFVRRGDPTTAECARVIGRTFGIPDSQMPFEGLFDRDHPNSQPPESV